MSDSISKITVNGRDYCFGARLDRGRRAARQDRGPILLPDGQTRERWLHNVSKRKKVLPGALCQTVFREKRLYPSFGEQSSEQGWTIRGRYVASIREA